MTPKQIYRRLRAIERLQRQIRAKFLYAQNSRGSPIQDAIVKKMALDLIEFYQLQYNDLFKTYKNLFPDDQASFIFQQQYKWKP
jgi:hypothetical protein